MTLENFLQIAWNRIVFESILAVGFTVVLYILPGWAMVLWCFADQKLNWREYTGLAAAFGIAIYPILNLWLYLLGIQPGPFLGPALAILSIGLIIIHFRRKGKSVVPFHVKVDVFNGLYIFIVLLLVVTRIFVIRDMIAPAWGDSVHHTQIVQLLLDHWGLFQSWAPYAPMITFTYHFGFHTLVASWSFLSTMDAAHSVLVVGQVINILSILVLYPLATRIAGGNQWAGIFAILIAGLWSNMPAYYVNWGRYTQLTGQLCLPVFIWMLDLWWHPKVEKHRLYILPMIVIIAGTFLIHYRIAIFLVTAGIAWTACSLISYKSFAHEWKRRTLLLLIAASLAAAIVLPWEVIVYSGKLSEIATSMVKRGVNMSVGLNDLSAWGAIYNDYSYWLWAIALFALVLGVAKRPQIIGPFVLWLLLIFLVTNPFLLFLPGSILITNFTLEIAAYIPISIFVGWLLSEINNWLTKKPYGQTSMATVTIIMIIGFTIPQFSVVDSFFQMVYPADIRSFRWINENIQFNTKFLVNGFLANSNSVVVGSDAGWWLPYYTKRLSTIPPILYIAEQLPAGMDSNSIRQTTEEVVDSKGNHNRLRTILCQNGITHVYLGEKQGQVGVGAVSLIPLEWLQQNSDFRLLHQVDQSQVWEFERTHCAAR